MLFRSIDDPLVRARALHVTSENERVRQFAHALREHARERMGKTAATRLGTGLLSSLLGLGNLGDAALSIGGQLLTLKFSREDESEADLVGLDLAARAGYDPSAGVTLWQKMLKASQGARCAARDRVTYSVSAGLPCGSLGSQGTTSSRSPTPFLASGISIMPSRG